MEREPHVHPAALPILPHLMQIRTEGSSDERAIDRLLDSAFAGRSHTDHAEAAIVIRTNQSKNVYIDTRHILGGSVGGRRFLNSAVLGVRAGNKFNSEYSIQQSNFDLPNGSVAATVFGARLSYSFTPRILAQALVQYNSVEDLISANIRFSILEQANTGLFVVYNAIRNAGDLGARDFTIKYTRIFDVIK